jgi:hypothetical protein
MDVKFVQTQVKQMKNVPNVWKRMATNLLQVLYAILKMVMDLEVKA